VCTSSSAKLFKIKNPLLSKRVCESLELASITSNHLME
jgi:hypothetical protein